MIQCRSTHSTILLDLCYNKLDIPKLTAISMSLKLTFCRSLLKKITKKKFIARGDIPKEKQKNKPKGKKLSSFFNNFFGNLFNKIMVEKPKKERGILLAQISSLMRF